MADISAVAGVTKHFPRGNGLDESSKLGPLINPKQLAKVTELVTDAVERGAGVAVGGEAPGGPGNFYPATVLTDVPADARILKEEVFGPVAPITGFDTEEEVSPPPTTPNTAWPPTFTHNRWTERCGSPKPSSPAWSASTAERSLIPPPRSAVSRNPVSVAKAAPKASRNTSTQIHRADELI
jgi:hypothetical protein